MSEEEKIELEEEEHTSPLTLPVLKRIIELLKPHKNWVFGFFIAILLSVIVIIFFIWTLDRRFEIGLKKNFIKAFPQLSDLMKF